MGCPEVNYGISSGGATEYSTSSGRELFQCGNSCVRLFIVNVSVETVNVKVDCDDISDAGTGTVCLRSGSMSLQSQGVVNWIAKDSVTSSLDNGSVINRAGACSGGDPFTYTHTDGQLSARVTANIKSIVDSSEEIMGAVESKCGCAKNGPGNAEFFMSDASTDVGPSEWQGGSITFQGFGKSGGGTETGRANFNWQNGIRECRNGSVEYDESSAAVRVDALIKGMIG